VSDTKARPHHAGHIETRLDQLRQNLQFGIEGPVPHNVEFELCSFEDKPELHAILKAIAGGSSFITGKQLEDSLTIVSTAFHESARAAWLPKAGFLKNVGRYWSGERWSKDLNRAETAHALTLLRGSGHGSLVIALAPFITGHATWGWRPATS
jgi:hypothetical protein